MFSSPGAGKSMDSLTPLSPSGRSEYPLHSSRRPSSRRGSTASSTTSIGGALNTSSNAFGLVVHESAQNAISSLLQTPIVRTGLLPYTSAPSSSSHKAPTSRDIPPVTLTNIPRIDPEEFNAYLSQVGALYEQLRRVQENEDDSIPSRKQEEPQGGKDGYLRPSSKTRMPRRGSNASVTSLGSIEASSPGRRSSVSHSRKGNQQGPPPLSTIPNVYFDDDFHLENPRTFDVVSERSEVIPSPGNESRARSDREQSGAPRKALATNAILQEKLSWYMDTIEIHLINSISTASTTFFTALGSLKELHSEAAESVQRIKGLREELEALDQEVATRGLDIVQKRRRQENLRRLNDAILQLRQVVDGLNQCESLVDAGEVDKALGKITSLEKMIAGEQGDADEEAAAAQLLDLRQTSALQGIDTDLSNLRFRIGRAYESQFTNILLSDLRRHVESVSISDVLLRWSNSASRARGHSRSPSVFPTYLTATEDLKTQLQPVMLGLSRAKHLSTAAMSFKDAVMREIRNIIRRPLPSSSDDDNVSMMSVSTAGGSRSMSSQEKSSNLARNLRALDAEDAEELLMKIYVGITETLRRLSTQVKVLLEITASLGDDAPSDGFKSPPIRSPISSPRPDRPSNVRFELQEELHKALDAANLLAQAVDIANDKIVKVLKVRNEQATQLPLNLFLRYFTLNLYFANECEAISGRGSTPLKNLVNGHIKVFVEKNRDAEMQKLAQGMESDQWGAKDFTGKNTQLLSDILDCSTQDAEAWTEGGKLWISAMELAKLEHETAAADTNGGEKEKVRPAVIDSEKFLLPASAILCMEGVGNFLHLAAGIPSMTTDVATSLVTYLQLFNSRCTQLILGAGATKSAGLRNITTKHLALASLALSFIATLVPHVREFMRRHAGSGAGVSNMAGEFDKIRRLLQEHQDSIHQKLVEIMSGRAAIHSKSIRAIAWDKDGATSAHPYMETLAKETTTLHRVLTRHLPEGSIQVIMQPVFASYKDQLGAALREADIKTEAGHNSMRTDVDLFTSKLGKLDGFGDAGDFLMEIVKSKEVVKPKEEPKGEPKAETEESKKESKEEPSDESKTTPEDNPEEESKEESREKPKTEEKLEQDDTPTKGADSEEPVKPTDSDKSAADEPDVTEEAAKQEDTTKSGAADDLEADKDTKEETKKSEAASNEADKETESKD